MVACAVIEPGVIGIDVAEIGDIQPDAGLLAASCGVQELALLSAQPPGRRPFEFARLWALKEAAAKALGVGEEFEPTHFEFTTDGALLANAYVSGTAARSCAFTTLCPSAQHVIAIARPAGVPELAVCAVDDDWVTFGPTIRDG